MTNGQYNVVGIGEILWDMLPEGAQLGGAPTNFACHVAMLGGKAYVASAVGDDKLGATALEIFRRFDVDTNHVTIFPDVPTGTVEVSVDAAGIASYNFPDNVAWDRIPWNDKLEALATEADAVCFGTLGQRGAISHTTIQQFLAHTRPDCLRIFDVNLRQQFYSKELILESLKHTSVLKLNEDELPIVAALCGVTETGHAALERICERYDLNLIALTRGANGCALFGKGRVSEHPGFSVTVKDTIGAGDSFTAAMTLGWLRGFDLDVIAASACRVGAFVSTQAGGTPELPDSVKF